MKIQVDWEFDLDHEHPDYSDIHDKFAAEQGVPLVVDLSEYFDDPSKVSEYDITDALSDEHGWLIYDWNVIESKSTVTVKDLIEALSNYHPSSEVVIEVNHDEVLPINLSKIEVVMITPEYRLAFEEDTIAKAATVIRL